MTADAYLVIRCDHRTSGEQCGTEWGHAGYVANHTELRRHLKAQGWTRSRGKDFCPDHPKESRR